MKNYILSKGQSVTRPVKKPFIGFFNLSFNSSFNRQARLLFGALLLLSAFSQTAVAEQGVLPGQQAPAFKLTRLDGEQLIFKQTAMAKPVYLKFWATWCSYCREEMPHLQHVQDIYGDKIEVVAVNVGMNDSIARINKFMEKRHLAIPVSFDAQGDLVETFQVLGTPQHILINKSGEIVHRSALITDDLQQKLLNVIKD